MTRDPLFANAAGDDLLAFIAAELLRARLVRAGVPTHLADDPAADLGALQTIAHQANVNAATTPARFTGVNVSPAVPAITTADYAAAVASKPKRDQDAAQAAADQAEATRAKLAGGIAVAKAREPD